MRENGDGRLDPSLMAGFEDSGGHGIPIARMEGGDMQHKVPNDLALLTQIAAAASGR